MHLLNEKVMPYSQFYVFLTLEFLLFFFINNSLTMLKTSNNCTTVVKTS